MSKAEYSYETMQKEWLRLTGATIETLKTEIAQQQIPDLKLFNTGTGTSALTIVDIEDNKYLYVDKHIESITGCAYHLYFSKGPKYIFTKANIDLIPKVISSTIHQTRFFKSKKVSEYNDFIVNRELSYRHESGRKWVLHQVLRHLVNKKGEIFAVATLQTTINHIKLDNRFRYYIYNRKLNEIVYPKNKKSKPSDIALNGLSTREKEIVFLILKGLTSKEISKQLFVSYHTIRTHRKNIFSKLDCHNVLELASRLELLTTSNE
ncbi:helix-turn-helix transcriptional regulator [Spongiivirga sp. MCCC 1A20706]|uniref:helix-turn-helix transcriptional regulator n=1 Tax=Spongiivirga sp. MCCC 1A20706 TaxID=3160963 RepID=UPI003977AC9A